MLQLEADICTDFGSASSREWLETNGIGGFACGTVSGVNTRRYHGLLTAATAPPLGRIRMLSKFEERLIIDGRVFELSANQYPGAVYPDGFKMLKSFRLDPFPIWSYEIDGVDIERRVFMVHGGNSTVCQWSLVDKVTCTSREIALELRPLIAFVDYHHLQHQDKRISESFEVDQGIVSIKPYTESPSLYFAHNGIDVEASGHWYKNFEYAIERERGFDFVEDLYQPFVLKFDLRDPAAVIVSPEMMRVGDAAKLERREIKRRAKLIEAAGKKDDFAARLVLAADQFIATRGNGQTIIAGYPWFSDWGRDTMISLPGLTLVTGRPKIAKQILLEFSKHISQGMLPNRFPDAGNEAEYNTVDATLWYFEALRAYFEFTSDYSFVRKQIYPKLVEIITWHLRGTRYNIHVDTDGLLYAGGPGVQLTWMDAKIGDLVITPRTGKPVEIQALWYNALRTIAGFAEKYSDPDAAEQFQAMADLAKISFNALFWNEGENCLFDVVENGNRDGSVRPNQIFAASLKNTMLDDERARMVVDKVEAELLTPVGLRTLSPQDTKYIPYCVGSPFERDSAYHQGTVWPWLVGAFIDAYRRVYPDRKQRVADILGGFHQKLFEAGLGQISEIFDAEPPYSPRGCFAQAWSVAEILRVLSASE